jgi:L-fucose isomerase-like protein
VANHPNRPVAMVHDFGLAPGAVTLARLTRRPSGEMALVIGRGEVLDTDTALHGTSAVVRFDHPVGEVLDRVIGDGLDHHLSMAYGHLTDELEALAAAWGVGVIDL